MVDEPDPTAVASIDVAEAPIRVLLVDDNEQWAKFMAGDLEAEDPSFEVIPTFSANEAILSLQEDESIDCVVTDYQMPEIDGIQLLERVRSERPQLPFLLVTGKGSEDVASRAIKRGVTDYIRKDPHRDQTSVFANRIRSAVEQYRLQRAVTESEQRYRSVTEQGRDAIAILREGYLVFCNRRLSALSGRDSSELSDSSFVDSLVHPDDREAMRRTIRDWQHGDGEADIQEVRLQTAGGEIRHCECTGGEITYGDEPAVLVSIRDVTRREERERELRWQRSLNSNVQTALIESRTRDRLELAIAEHLSAYGYDLVWIGEPGATELKTRVSQGDRSYLDEVELALEGADNDSEPGIWAVRSGEPQFVQDFTDLFPSSWRDAALECGFAAGAALPLAYDEVSYGVLAVYHDRPGRFDETERRLLTELADTVGFAIHTIETEQALTAETAVRARLQARGGTACVDELAQRLTVSADDATVTVHGTLPYDDDRFIQYVGVDESHLDDFLDTARSHDHVSDVTVLRDGDAPRVQLILAEPPPEDRLASLGIVVSDSTVDAGHRELELELPDKRRLSDAVESLREDYDTVSVLSTVEIDRAESAARQPALNTATLTDKQAAALRAAYQHGYFERPRTNSASDIAESLGITHSTFLQHLRSAQRKIFAEHFE